MKIKKLYRIIYTSDFDTYGGEFYTNKEEAIDCFNDAIKYVREHYEDLSRYLVNSSIFLQEINLNEVIDCYANGVMLSEWKPDEEGTKRYRKDMKKERIK